MSATAFLAELNAAGIAVQVQDGKLRLTAGRGTLTPNLLESVKSCKQDLLKILKSPSLSTVGALFSPGTPRAQASPVASEYSVVQPTNKVDAEFDRFARVAQPMPDGGLCPVYGSPRMPSGILGERWDEFIADFAHLGKAVRP